MTPPGGRSRPLGRWACDGVNCQAHMAAAGSVAERLGWLDLLAQQLLARSAPVCFGVSDAPDELEAVFRLRCQTVVAQGWAPASTFPDGLERDDFDDRARHVTGWDGPTLVACARLVFPEPGQPLPTEREFALRIEPAGGVVDVGRGIVAPAYRSHDHAVFAALLARCWVEVRARAFHHLCGTASAHRLERYRQLGLPLRVLGPSRLFWGEERYPLYLDGVEFAELARARIAAQAG
jgi:Acetyltransferase (GNAT) domain